MHRLPVFFSSALLASLSAPLATAQNPTWIRQLGTPFGEAVQAAAPDGANGVFLGGYSFGALGGPHAGEMDAWLGRFDGAGNQLWSRQLGSWSWDWIFAAASDGAGGVIVGGRTDAGLSAPTVGASDAWLARYDGLGNQVWIRQFGTNRNDFVYAAVPDGSGGVFVGGYTEGSLGGPNGGSNNPDAWLARYDAAGAQLWIRQFGTSESDYLRAIASDGSGGVIAGGFTSGSVGGWLARYDGAGNQVWIRQFGSSDHAGLSALTPDGLGGVLAAGLSSVPLTSPNVGQGDVWIARYDGTGNRLWIRQFGSTGTDSPTTIASDGIGGAIVGGHTWGSLAAPAGGFADAWLARYDTAGNRTWVRQFGTSQNDELWAVAPNGMNAVIVGGRTHGSFGGPNVGVADVWFARFDIGPLAASYCTAGTTANGCVPAISGAGAASASATSGFTIAVDDLEGQRQGLFFYGLDSAGFTPLPWGAGSSFLCVKPPLQRAVVLNSGGTPNLCDGSLAFDWNAYRAAHPAALGQPFAAGTNVFAQAWFRDPPAPKSTSLSDGLRFLVQP